MSKLLADIRAKNNGLYDVPHRRDRHHGDDFYLELNPPPLPCLNIPDIIRHARKQRLTLDSIKANSLYDFFYPKQPSDDEQAQR